MSLKLVQTLLVDWGIRAFGRDHMYGYHVRTLRFAEEVIELAQALSVTEEQMHLLVDVVYARPKGDFLKEMGGVLATLLVLCNTLDIDPEASVVDELRRVLEKSSEHFAKRNDEKIALGLK